MNLFGVSFRHGVHPPDSKSLTAASPVRRMPFPERIALPLRQHAGKPARCLVRKGDRVERGDTIAEADGFVSLVAGIVAATEDALGAGARFWAYGGAALLDGLHDQVAPQLHLALGPRGRRRGAEAEGDEQERGDQQVGGTHDTGAYA